MSIKWRIPLGLVSVNTHSNPSQTTVFPSWDRFLRGLREHLKPPGPETLTPTLSCPSFIPAIDDPGGESEWLFPMCTSCLGLSCEWFSMTGLRQGAAPVQSDLHYPILLYITATRRLQKHNTSSRLFSTSFLEDLVQYLVSLETRCLLWRSYEATKHRG